jgi:hypothetical protein
MNDKLDHRILLAVVHVPFFDMRLSGLIILSPNKSFIKSGR